MFYKDAVWTLLRTISPSVTKINAILIQRKKMKKIIMILSLLIGLLYADNSMPVMYGGDVDGDACASIGEIRGINKHDDGFVAIRSGAGSKYSMKDKIRKNGTNVIMCDSHGKWIGIVYGDDCGTSSPIAKKQPYKGSCKSGWVYEKYVVLIAG